MVTLSKKRMPRGTDPAQHRWEAYIPQGWLDLMIEVRASSRAEAKRLVRELAHREYGYRELKFTR